MNKNIFYEIDTPLQNGKHHIHELPLNYDKDKSDSIYKFKSHGKKFPSVVDLEEIPCHPRKGVLLTDVLSAAYFGIPYGGIIANTKFCEFLQKYKISSYKEYPVSLIREDELLKEYKYLYFSPIDIVSQVNLENSEFYEKNMIKSKIVKNELLFSNIKEITDYMANLERMHFLQSKKISLNEKSEILDFDLIRLTPFVNGIYMSEKMKKAYDSEGLTGLEFEKRVF